MRKKKEIIVSLEPKVKRRTVPSSAFKKGNAHAFKPGVSGNPSGRPKSSEHIVSRALRIQLGQRAPNEIVLQLGLSPGASWGMCVSSALLHAAARGDVQAAREIREATEGHRSQFGLIDDDGNMPSPIEIIFVPTGGDGRPRPAPVLPTETV